jgi:membrane protease YdiL (CAAX protease family)
MDARAERARRVEEVAIALTLTVTAAALHGWLLLQMLWQRALGSSETFTYRTVVALVFLVLGLMLALPVRRRSGLTLGHRPRSWGALAGVVLVPVIAVMIVYPQLPERPFALASRSMWLITPAAEAIWFLGVIYGRLEAVFPNVVHRTIPIRQALLFSAAFFCLCHVLLGLFSTLSPGFVVFQALYTFTGFVFLGMTRQWTGSILYAIVTTMAVNYLAWSIA